MAHPLITENIINFFEAWDNYQYTDAMGVINLPDVQEFFNQYKPRQNVTLYRGLHWRIEDRHNVDFMGGNYKKGSTITQTTDRPTSWATTEKAALAFAESEIHNGEEGMVIKGVFAPKDILVDYNKIPKELFKTLLPSRGGSREENEVIVKQGTYDFIVHEIVKPGTHKSKASMNIFSLPYTVTSDTVLRNVIINELGQNILPTALAAKIQPLDRYSVRKDKIFGDPSGKERFRITEIAGNSIFYRNLNTRQLKEANINDLLESWVKKGFVELSPIDEIINWIKSTLTTFLGSFLTGALIAWIWEKLGGK